MASRAADVSDDSAPQNAPSLSFFGKAKRWVSKNLSQDERKLTSYGTRDMAAERRERKALRRKNAVTLDGIPTWNESECAFEGVSSRTNPPSRGPHLSEKISLYFGDITDLEVDVVVNAANEGLRAGSGVNRAICEAAGPQLLQACRAIGGCETGRAVMTRAYNLPAKYVVHVVGPQTKDPVLLRSCYIESLERLLEANLRTIAFPCISTGIYGYPEEEAALVAVSSVCVMLKKHPDRIDRVVFCVFTPTSAAIYRDILQVFFPDGSEECSKERGRKRSPSSGL